MSKRLLLIAPHSSYRIAAYLHAAARLGIEVKIAAQGEHTLVNQSSHGIHINLQDPDAALETLLQVASGTPFDAILATDDHTVELAARVAASLGLTHNPASAAQLSRRKDLARARLKAAGLPVPEHRRLDLDQPMTEQLNGFPFPLVVKPIALSASRGVIRCDNEQQLIAAIQRIRSTILTDVESVEERRYLLLERYLPGIEVAVEGLLNHGRFTPITVFDKPDPLVGPYFEETYYITPSRLAEPVQRAILQRVAQGCAAYGLSHGPVHAELRWHNNEAWIVEIAARSIGGECARLLQMGSGQTLEEIIINQAIGGEFHIDAQSEASGVLMIPTPEAGILRRIEGVSEAQKVELIEELRLWKREGHELTMLPEGSSYLGFMYARGETPAAVEHALRTAHAKLNIVVAPLWRIGAG